MKSLFLIPLLILAFISFYRINELNHTKIQTIKFSLTQHPEMLPKKDVAKNSSFGFSHLKADLYWLEAIQYIWSNAVSSEFKKYLYTMIDVITELDPYYEHPYIIWELLLPWYDARNKNISHEQQKNYTNQAINIGLKGIKTYCDPHKLALIKKEFDLNKLWSDAKYNNACKSYKIPYNLAFIYYFYLKDANLASFYYKVSSTIDDSIEWAKVMSAIMQWKWWDREKSFFMFLGMASTNETQKDQEVCREFSKKFSALAFNGKIKNNSAWVKWLEETRIKLFPKKKKEENKKTDDTVFKKDNCLFFFNKAVREFNLSYIDQANNKYISDNKHPAKDALELQKKWYIDFLPTDPKYKEDDDFPITYKYNDEFKTFDFSRGKYDN